MADNHEMLDNSRNLSKQFGAGLKLEQNQWAGSCKFFSDNSLMDKRRSKRARARARMQRNYIAAKAQLKSAVPKRDRESKREQRKDTVHKQGTLVNVSAAYLANEEDSMDQLDKEVEKITMSMHLEAGEEDGTEGVTRVVDMTHLTEDQTSDCKTTSEESAARYDTPLVPRLPQPSAMVLRPNHEAFFDEDIGAPIAKNSTLSIENSDPRKPKKPSYFRIRNAKPVNESKRSSKFSFRKRSLAQYFLQCLRPQMPSNEL